METKIFGHTRTQVLSFYGKTDEDMKEYLEILRKWMEKQKHLPSDLLKDNFLEICLLRCKFSVEKVKYKIENYCTLRLSDRMKYFYEEKLPVPSKEAGFFIPMPKLTDDFQRVIVIKCWDIERHELFKSCMNGVILREFLSRYDYNGGEIIVLDFCDMSSMTMLSQFRVNYLSDAMNLLSECHAAKLRQIHFVSKSFTTLWNLVKPFLSPKILSRISGHENYESLRNAIPPKYLPKDYGGELKSLHEITNDLDIFFEEHHEEWLSYIKIKSREEFRETGVSMNEMDGTFRKLTID